MSLLRRSSFLIVVAIKSLDKLDSSYWSSYLHLYFTLPSSTLFLSNSRFSITGLFFTKKLDGFDFTVDDVVIVSLNALDKYFVARAIIGVDVFGLIDWSELMYILLYLIVISKQWINKHLLKSIKKRLAHFRAIPEPIQCNCAKVKSTGVHSQHCTTAAMNIGLFESKMWYGALSMMTFDEVQFWLHFQWWVWWLTPNKNFSGWFK